MSFYPSVGITYGQTLDKKNVGGLFLYIKNIYICGNQNIYTMELKNNTTAKESRAKGRAFLFYFPSEEAKAAFQRKCKDAGSSMQGVISGLINTY